MRKLAAFVALAALATPAVAELPTSSSAQIAEAVTDCWSAVSEAPVNAHDLETKGWRKASMRSAKGQDVPAGFDLYRKSGTGALVFISKNIDPRGCLVVSSAGKAEDVSAAIPLILAGMRGTDPATEVKKVSAQEVGFFALPKAALLALTGTPAKPGVRIQVSYTAPEKK